MIRKYYNELACKYDQMVKDKVVNDKFPYGAYDEVQDIIGGYISEPREKDKVKVLDIGIGTGSLYEKVLPERAIITGIDISEQMLEVAKLRLPDATLIQHDILTGLPEAIENEKYDFIIINYVFVLVEFPKVVALIELLQKHLSRFGKIMIADVMFLDEIHKKLFVDKYPELKAKDQHYHLYSNFVKKIKDDLALSYMEVNDYTGIVIIENYYDYTLQLEETIVKYKSNTMKWKSSHPQKQRE